MKSVHKRAKKIKDRFYCSKAKCYYSEVKINNIVLVIIIILIIISLLEGHSDLSNHTNFNLIAVLNIFNFRDKIGPESF